MLFAQGEQLILTQKEDVEHLYSQAVVNGMPDAVVFMLDLACSDAEGIAREWLGDGTIDQALDRAARSLTRAPSASSCRLVRLICLRTLMGL